MFSYVHAFKYVMDIETSAVKDEYRLRKVVPGAVSVFFAFTTSSFSLEARFPFFFCLPLALFSLSFFSLFSFKKSQNKDVCNVH